MNNFRGPFAVLFTFLFFKLEELHAACDSATQGCISTPEGLLSNSDKIKGATGTFNWILLSVSLTACIVFAIKAGKKLHDEDFVGAIGPFLGSLVAGLTPFIAKLIVK